MRLQSPWTPRLAHDDGSPCDRLVAALAEDILEGHLASGDRLPPHRDLSWKLDIGLGTVTRAYGILERRGLVRTIKGSGTFVAAAERRRGPEIDLSRNVPPSVLTERLLARTLNAVAKRVDADLFNTYPPAVGHDEFRRQMARWFARAGLEAAPGRLLLTNGAQHALSLAFATVAEPGRALFFEEQSYPGAIALARQTGRPVKGIAIDNEGMRPEALDRALSAAPSGSVVYLQPTMHNPTTATMSLARRQAIVEVCRKNDCWIIEDDVYALGANGRRPPLAMLAPERTLYVNSLSKTLSPGLRLGGLVVPETLFAHAEEVIYATAMTPPPMSCALMEQWLIDGTADAISQAIETESRKRRDLALSTLGDAAVIPHETGFHLWLPMSHNDAERLVLAAETLGVRITPPDTTRADDDAEPTTCGIRLCIGTMPLPDLRQALEAITSLLAQMRAAGSEAPRRLQM